MRNTVSTLILSLGLVGASQVFASTETDSILGMLKAKYPNTAFTSVSKGPINGTYEVVMGRNVGYTDATGKYFIFGNVFDMETRRDLTAERKQALNKLDWASLPLASAIKIVKGDGKATFAVFADPDCPYCKRLEQNLAGLKSYTMYLFLMPLAGLHPDAPAKSESVWCADDKAKAWTDLVLNGKEPAAKKCPNPLAAIQQIASSNGIAGTPTLVRMDGAITAGALPAEKIQEWLAAAGK